MFAAWKCDARKKEDGPRSVWFSVGPMKPVSKRLYLPRKSPNRINQVLPEIAFSPL
jgi:hypothetical protein